MLAIRTFILRLLVNPAEPEALHGDLRPMPEGEAQPFPDEQALLAPLHRLASPAQESPSASEKCIGNHSNPEDVQNKRSKDWQTIMGWPGAQSCTGGSSLPGSGIGDHEHQPGHAPADGPPCAAAEYRSLRRYLPIHYLDRGWQPLSSLCDNRSWASHNDYGLHVENSRVVVSDTLFTGNGTASYDAPIFITGTASVVTLTHNIIDGNSGHRGVPAAMAAR